MNDVILVQFELVDAGRMVKCKITQRNGYLFFITFSIPLTLDYTVNFQSFLKLRASIQEWIYRELTFKELRALERTMGLKSDERGRTMPNSIETVQQLWNEYAKLIQAVTGVVFIWSDYPGAVLPMLQEALDDDGTMKVLREKLREMGVEIPPDYVEPNNTLIENGRFQCPDGKGAPNA